MGIPRDCCKYKTKMVSRNALNPIWEETFEIEVHLPELAFARFTVSLIILTLRFISHCLYACRTWCPDFGQGGILI